MRPAGTSGMIKASEAVFKRTYLYEIKIFDVATDNLDYHLISQVTSSDSKVIALEDLVNIYTHNDGIGESSWLMHLDGIEDAVIDRYWVKKLGPLRDFPEYQL